jgi:predicted SprT family Zn-dependent metalloprotease
MNKKLVRTNPPSESPNNQDALVFALYLLGGSDRDIDVEDMFLKCHELAPARLSWRTRPDLPDYKKVSKALQSVEASTHVGLFHHSNQYARRLTLDGNRWVETYISILERVYSKAPVQASKNTNMHERKRHEIKNSQVWVLYKESPADIGIEDFASVLQCSAASSQTTWASRVHDVKRAADVLQDQELMQFAQLVELRVLDGENNK